MSEVVLEVKDLNAFYGRAHVLQDVAFTVDERPVAIIGRNGMGKSTLCQVIMGMLTSARGSVRFHGQELMGKPPYRIAREGLGFVPQGRRLFPSLSTDEHLKIIPRRGNGGWTPKRVYETFPRLAARKNVGAGQLSGGEQQMLAIGRALMNRPTLLLLDEPSLGLSPILVREIFTIIRRVNEEQGMSILLVEQNAKVALETAHYGYVLEIGRVVMNDSCERLIHSKDIQEFYLGAKEAGARGERRWKKKKTWR